MEIKKTICVVTPCFNEESNVVPLYEAVKAEFQKLPQYEYCHLFIDKNPSLHSVDNYAHLS